MDAERPCRWGNAEVGTLSGDLVWTLPQPGPLDREIGQHTQQTKGGQHGGNLEPLLPWGLALLWAAQRRGPVPAALSPPAGAARGGSVLTAGRFGPWRSGLLRRQSGSVLFTFKGVI